jgi:hypothetical protein
MYLKEVQLQCHETMVIQHACFVRRVYKGRTL